MFLARHPSARLGHLKRLAFTMVELLVVLLILTSLVAMVVGVGRMLSQEQERQLTRTYQEIVLAAIQKYADFNGGDVPANPADPGPGATYVGVGVARPGEAGGGEQMTDTEWEIYARNALMYAALEAEPACLDILDRLPRGAVLRGVLGAPAAFIDAYGNYMDYRESGAFGGPLLISGGADGYIGGEHVADDIRSDRRSPAE